MREYYIETFVADYQYTVPSWSKCTKKLNNIIEKGWILEHITSPKNNVITGIFYREKKTSPQLLKS